MRTCGGETGAVKQRRALNERGKRGIGRQGRRYPCERFSRRVASCRHFSADSAHKSPKSDGPILPGRLTSLGLRTLFYPLPVLPRSRRPLHKRALSPFGSTAHVKREFLDEELLGPRERAPLRSIRIPSNLSRRVVARR